VVCRCTIRKSLHRCWFNCRGLTEQNYLQFALGHAHSRSNQRLVEELAIPHDGRANNNHSMSISWASLHVKNHTRLADKLPTVFTSLSVTGERWKEIASNESNQCKSESSSGFSCASAFGILFQRPIECQDPQDNGWTMLMDLSGKDRSCVHFSNVVVFRNRWKQVNKLC